MPTKAETAARELQLARRRRDFSRERPQGVFDAELGELQKELATALAALNPSPYRLVQATDDPWQIAVLDGTSTVGRIHVNRANLPELSAQVVAGGHETMLGPYRLQPAAQPIGSLHYEWVAGSVRAYAKELADLLLAGLLDAVRAAVQRS